MRLERFKEAFTQSPDFMPITNARQKVEVSVKDGKTLLKIKKSPISAEELINEVK